MPLNETTLYIDTPDCKDVPADPETGTRNRPVYRGTIPVLQQPVVELVFHTATQGTIDLTSEGDFEDNDAVSVSVTKGLSDPTGEFSITLKQKSAKYNWRKILSVGDHVEILAANGVDSGRKGLMWGIITDIPESISADNFGATNNLITVRGRDHGYILSNSQLFTDLSLVGTELEKQLNTYAGVTLLQHTAKIIVDIYNEVSGLKNPLPVDIVRLVLKNVLERLTQFPVPPKISSTGEIASGSEAFVNYLNFDHYWAESSLRLLEAISVFTTKQSISLWSFLAENANTTFNEFYTDYFGRKNGRGYPFVILRKRPFTKRENAKELGLGKFETTWDDLFTTTLTLGSDVKGINITRNDSQVVNYLKLFPFFLSSQPDYGVNIIGPAFISPSISRFGVRYKSIKTPFLASVNGKIDISQYLRKQIELMHWYGKNEVLYSGTIQCRFLPQIKVGERIIIQNPLDQTGQSSLQFYVEAISHRIDGPQTGLGGRAETVLNISRGVNVSDDASLSLVSISSRNPQTIQQELGRVSKKASTFSDGIVKG